jgi:hypothetical protein
MAIVTRRFKYFGPWPVDVKAAIDPALALPTPTFVIMFDIVYDDSIATAPVADERMRHYGCFPDTQDTIALSPIPFLGLVSPDNSIWKLSVDNLGIVTSVKVSP